jgi:Domain of unknown function (DUF4331)
MPLVNEVVIGLKDKDRFNASKPSSDGQFIDYVTSPTLPALRKIALGAPGIAPTNFPRNVVASEMLRLNTAIPAVPLAQQNRLGIVGNILAGATTTPVARTAAGPRTTWSTSRWWR